MPAAPVRLGGPVNPPSLTSLQERLNRFNRLAAEELVKGADCDEDLVAQLQARARQLIAPIDRQETGEGQCHAVCAVL